jgi:hypothetical protein
MFWVSFSVFLVKRFLGFVKQFLVLVAKRFAGLSERFFCGAKRFSVPWFSVAALATFAQFPNNSGPQRLTLP